jgi:predicted Rossmann-fold nucleotide-binding protein
VGLLNMAGYYDGLIGFLQSSVKQDFMGDWQMDLIRIGSDPESLLGDLIQASGLSAAPRLEDI